MKNLAALLVFPAILGVLSAPAFAQHIGDYDSHHVWHDADWWHQHDPDWVAKHHPDWIKQHPEWKPHDHNHDHDNHAHDHDQH
jgi:hypothetical protein